MEYRRTDPHPRLPTFPLHTHIYPNLIPLDSWSISQDSITPLGSLCVHRPCQGYTHNPSGLPERSQGCTYNPTGLPVRSQGCTLRQTPSQDVPLNLSPPSRVLCFILYILQETAPLSVCNRQVLGLNPPEFLLPCDLPVSCCLAMSLVVRSRNSKRLVPLRVSMRASVWTQPPGSSSSPRIFLVLRGMKAAFASVRPPPRDLGVRGASIVQCGLSCLVDLNSDLYRLCGSLHGPDIFWARGLS